MEIFKLFGTIGADDKPAKKAIDSVVDHAKSANNVMSNGLKNIGSVATSMGSTLTKFITAPALAATTALAGVALKKGWDRLTGIDDARAKLMGLGHDGEAIQVIMKSALDSVRGTSFGMDEAATTAANAVAAGVKQGEDLTKYLKMTADAAAIAGISMGEMGSIMNKVQTGGRAMTENLEQLSDRGLPVYQWLAKEANVSADAVKDLASSGKISSEMFFNAIEKNIGGAAAIMGENSFKATISNIWASVGRIGANFLDAGGKGGGFFSTIKPLLADFNKSLGNVEQLASDLGVKFGESFGKAIEFVTDLKNKFDALSPAAQGSLIKSVSGFAGFAVAAGPALKVFGSFSDGLGTAMGVVEKFNGGLGAVPKALQSAFGSSEGQTNILKRGFDTLITKGSDFGGKMADMGGKTTSILSSLMPESVKSNFGGALNDMGDYFNGWGITIKGKSDSTFDSINKKIFEFQAKTGRFEGQGIFSFFDKIGEKMNFIDPLFGGLKDKISGLPSVFGSVFSGIAGSLGNFSMIVLKLIGPAAIVGALIAGLGLAQQTFGTQLDAFFQMAQTKGPNLIIGLVNGINQKIPELMELGTTLIINFLETITANLPAIIQGGSLIIFNLINSLAQNVPRIIPVVLELINVLITNLVTALPLIVSAGLNLIMALAQGFSDNLPKFLEMVGELIPKIIQSIARMLPQIIKTGIEVIKTLALGFVNAIPILIKIIPQIFEALKAAFASIDWAALGKLALDAIVEVFSTLVSVLSDVFAPVLDWMNQKKEEIKSKFGDMAKGVKNAWDGTKDFFSGMWDGVKSSFEGVGSWMGKQPSEAAETIKNAWNGTKDFFSGMWESVRTSTETVWKAIVDFFAPIVTDLMAPFEPLITFFSGLWEQIQTIAGAAWELIKTAVMAPILLLIDLVTGDFEQFKEDLGMIWQTIKDNVSLIWQTIKDVVVGYVTALVDTAINLWNNFVTGLSIVWQAITTGVTTAWENIKQWLITTVTTIIDNVKQSWENLKQNTINIFNALVDAAKQTWENFKQWLSDLVTNVVDSVKQGWENLKQGTIDIFNGLVEGAKQAWENLKTSVTDAVDRVKSIFTTLSEINLLDIGRAIIDGFVSGLTGAWEKGKEFIGGIGDWIREHKGPIEVDKVLLTPAGGAIMDGLHDGLVHGFSSVQDYVSDMASEMENRFNPDLQASIGYDTSNGSVYGSSNQDATIQTLLTSMLQKFEEWQKNPVTVNITNEGDLDFIRSYVDYENAAEDATRKFK